MEPCRRSAAAQRLCSAVRRVMLFGLLAHTAWFVPDSDVDLAVKRLPGDDYWRAWCLAKVIVGDRGGDLIEIEAGGNGRAAERVVSLLTEGA